MEILAKTTWRIHWGGLKHPQGGLDGQLTKCRWNGWIFWVRENVRLFGGHFGISSGERMALKEGRLAKRHAQVLELCAPSSGWDEIALAVKAADALHRPVLRNRNFTESWAKRTLRTSEDSQLHG